MAAVVTVDHQADVHGYGFLFYWACSCGKSGKPTTNGRASAGRDRHLRAVRK
jgi:hypothetical protein